MLGQDAATKRVSLDYYRQQSKETFCSFHAPTIFVLREIFYRTNKREASRVPRTGKVTNFGREILVGTDNLVSFVMVGLILKWDLK